MNNVVSVSLKKAVGTFVLIILAGVHTVAGNTGIRLTAETGFLAVLSHKIQQSNDNTYFDYVQDGGQDVLFNITRYTADWRINNRHTVTFLYQPLALEGTETVTETLLVDDAVFPAGTAMRFFYGFPFYRASWLYDTDPSPDRELAFGISMQIRNATITFEALDGSVQRSQRDIGPVPILKMRWRQPAGQRFWIGAEADGFYAPISYLNGSDEEVTGAILDASVRAGLNMTDDRDAFLNVRYLGGGAVGTSDDDIRFGDGYVKNWLHFLTVTLGFGLGI